jgi:plasmid maintenance system antidote protein VapI
MACRKRKMLNLEQRIDVIKQHDKGVSCRALAQTLNVGKTQIQKIITDRALSDCDNSLQTLMDYALSFNNSQLLDDVANCLDIISTIQRSRASKAQQSTMLQFFK